MEAYESKHMRLYGCAQYNVSRISDRPSFTPICVNPCFSTSTVLVNILRMMTFIRQFEWNQERPTKFSPRMSSLFITPFYAYRLSNTALSVFVGRKSSTYSRDPK